MNDQISMKFILSLALSIQIVISQSRDVVLKPIGFWPFTQQYGGKDILGTNDAELNGVQAVDGPNNSDNSALLLRGELSSFIRISLDHAKFRLIRRFTVTLFLYAENTLGPIWHIMGPISPHVWLADQPDLLYMHTGGTDLIYSSYGTIQSYKWHYVAAVYDSIAQLIQIYRDMELVGQKSCNKLPSNPLTGNVYMGALQNGDSRHLRARIFCVQFFDIALTATQIKQSRENCERILSFKPKVHLPKPLGFWPFTPKYEGRNLMETGDAELQNVIQSNGLNDAANSALFLTGSRQSSITIPFNELTTDVTIKSYTVTMYLFFENGNAEDVLSRFVFQNSHIRFQFHIFPINGTLHIANRNILAQSTSGTIRSNRWYYLAAVVDRSSKWMGIYRDAELVAWSALINTVVAAPGSIKIACTGCRVRIFCVQLFNNALKKSQIEQAQERCDQIVFGCRKSGLDGSEYMGTLSVTSSGTSCQLWTTHSPHPHQFSNKNNRFPDGSVIGARNYCRNPDGKSQPWCYTTNPKTVWEFCNVPVCDDHVPQN